MIVNVSEVLWNLGAVPAGICPNQKIFLYRKLRKDLPPPLGGLNDSKGDYALRRKSMDCSALKFD